MTSDFRTASSAAVAAFLAASSLATVEVRAQAPVPPGPVFEVASVKPSNPDLSSPFGGIPRIVPVGGRLTITNVALRMLIVAAFQVQSFQVVGGPSDLPSNKFDITAKAPRFRSSWASSSTPSALRSLMS